MTSSSLKAPDTNPLPVQPAAAPVLKRIVSDSKAAPSVYVQTWLVAGGGE